MRIVGITVCTALLIAFVWGLKSSLMFVHDHFGYWQAISACLAVVLVSLVIGYLIDEHDRRRKSADHRS